MKQQSKNNLPIFIVGLLFGLALSIFFILDFALAISVYLKFTLVYTTFWILLGGIFLYRQAKLTQGLMLGMFLVATLTIYLINWDSRKAFLKDFWQVETGMTTAQVEEILPDYIKFVGPTAQLNAQGRVEEGTISYQHTTAGWGDADIGLIVIENGQVVARTFYPD